MDEIYEFLNLAGELVGCGTEAELAELTRSGILENCRLGKRLGWQKERRSK